MKCWVTVSLIDKSYIHIQTTTISLGGVDFQMLPLQRPVSQGSPLLSLLFTFIIEVKAVAVIECSEMMEIAVDNTEQTLILC